MAKPIMDIKLTISKMINYGSIVHWRMLIIIGQAYNGYKADPSVRWSVGVMIRDTDLI